MEKELNVKYTELRELFSEQTALEDKQNNIIQWKDAKNRWDRFLVQWKQWNTDCFIEYLKRVSYVDKSYN